MSIQEYDVAYVEGLIAENEELETQLEAVRPYLQHRSDCHANTGFIGAECGCGLKSAIGEGET